MLGSSDLKIEGLGKACLRRQHLRKNFKDVKDVPLGDISQEFSRGRRCRG